MLQAWEATRKSTREKIGKGVGKDTEVEANGEPAEVSPGLDVPLTDIYIQVK
jgi:hypothetical protein